MDSSTENLSLLLEIQNILERIPELSNAPNAFVNQLSKEITERISYGQKESIQKKLEEIESLQEEVRSVHYFMPSVVSLVYTQKKPSGLDQYSQKVTERHFQFLQRAVSSVVRRFSGNVHNFHDGMSDLEEELWGQTLEDLMRQLTDRQARLWNAKNKSLTKFPPDIQRRGNHGAIARLALSEDVSKLALFHTDQTLSVWDTNKQEEEQVFDLSFLHFESEKLTPETTPVAIHFSKKNKFIGVEYPNTQIAVIPLIDQAEIEIFDANNIVTFFKNFGPPTPSYQNSLIVDNFDQVIQDNLNENSDVYIKSVYDWVCSADGNILVTASDEKRQMPQWMLDIGFEKSVYVIVKRRLIDWIRKNTHATYVCWYCGVASASHNETHCKNCGADFSDCILQLPTPPCDPPTKENNWTCSHCGLSSRKKEPMAEPKENDLYGERFDIKNDWLINHDYSRIRDRLKELFLTYRKRKIQCTELLDLKAQGLTNEEIGEQLQVPRGSVDYLWSQCRDYILKYFDDN